MKPFSWAEDDPEKDNQRMVGTMKEYGHPYDETRRPRDISPLITPTPPDVAANREADKSRTEQVLEKPTWWRKE